MPLPYIEHASPAPAPLTCGASGSEAGIFDANAGIIANIAVVAGYIAARILHTCTINAGLTDFALNDIAFFIIAFAIRT